MIRGITILSILVLVGCSSKRLFYNQEISNFRKEYKEKFLQQSEGPLKKNQLKDLEFFEVDSTYRVLAKVERLKKQKPVEFQTSSGMVKQYIPFVKAVFDLNQKSHSVIIYKSVRLMSNPMYKDYLFLPFTDLTSGETTYGGGRYLDFREKEIKNGHLVLDFNKAYNPYCAYSSGYNCPIPPKSNFINTMLKAGEKSYEGEYNY